MSDPNLTIDDLAALPERMRAHAAAKAVGMTSKEFLAAMAGIGVEIKSAQSGVTRDVLLTWFNSRSDAPAGAAAEVPTTVDEVGAAPSPSPPLSSWPRPPPRPRPRAAISPTGTSSPSTPPTVSSAMR